MRLLLLCLLAALAMSCGERVVYVYPDAGAPPDAGERADGSGEIADGGASLDAPELPMGACLPHREAGEVSSADCHRYAATPVCAGGTDTDPDTQLSRCVAAPSHYCAACETDAQCQTGVDLRSECVFIPYDGPYPYDDQACLSPCATDDDCAFLPRPAWTGVRCLALPRGRYCVVPFADGDETPTCSDFHGGRRGDGT